MLTTERDHHKVQQLRSDQDGKHHRGHLGRFAHNRCQNPAGEQHPAAIEQAEEGIEIGELGKGKGNPGFKADGFLSNPQIEIHPDQDTDQDRESGPDHDLARLVLVLQLAIGRKHDRTTGPKRRCRRRVGDTAQDRAQNRNNQNQRWEHHADQFVFGQTRRSSLAPIEGNRQRTGHQHECHARRRDRRDQEHVDQDRKDQTDSANQQRTRI